jgi:hypothetical protein
MPPRVLRRLVAAARDFVASAAITHSDSFEVDAIARHTLYEDPDHIAFKKTKQKSKWAKPRAASRAQKVSPAAEEP